MKIGFYGGTFDPIHNGHLIAARDAVEALGLDRLYFIPNAISPHKLGERPVDPALRLEMLRIAIGDEPRFDLDAWEIGRPHPSYTIETMLEMRERFGPEAEFFYLIGHDNVPMLHTWRRIEELHRLVEFVVLSRTVAEDQLAPLPYRTLHRRVDISGTEIRKRVANGLSIRYFVPDGVYDLILTHHLYQA